MHDPSSLDMIWWITAVELPALGGLFWLVWRTRSEGGTAIDRARQHFDAETGRQRESLAAYKLEVAQSYASISYMKDVEHRLTRHLLRIETKLDAVSRPASVHS